jgi:hypothetical protein
MRTHKGDIVKAVIGVLLLLMVLGSGIRYYKTTTCQTNYNKSVSLSLAQRSEAQKQEGQAQIELLTASLGSDREAAARETREYIAAIQELERVRAASPIPAPPDCNEQR